MGQEISQSGFAEQESVEFQVRLRKETAVLKDWFERRAFDYASVHSAGMELEAWLVDANFLPAPRNAEFLAVVNHPDVVAELSQFNFELNSPPLALSDDYLRRTFSTLSATWQRCVHAASTLDIRPLQIGILPTVRDQMLQLQWMTATHRYHALNVELARLRGETPVHIEISADDTLDYYCNHIMLEAACTSLQVHLKVNQEEACRFYNASLIACAPLVAATANAPFLYGKSLWAESRIPAFEQVTAAQGFKGANGAAVGRTTLGTGYARRSLLEIFLENLSYPVLLPSLYDDAGTLPHLRLHNGTLWRWCRPLIGFESDGTPHLRLEQRVMSAGPSLVDVVANIALAQGLTLYLGRATVPPEEQLSFAQACSNFHACARHGLDACIRWDGREVRAQSLLLDTLIPAAKSALAQQGVAADDLDYYFDEVLHRRILSGRTGAVWQRSFVATHGKDFQALTDCYARLQAHGQPVHEWPV